MEDSVTDAARRMNCKFIETLFYRIALDQGYGRTAEGKARELYSIYEAHSYKGLPEFAKKYIREVCDGQRVPSKCQ